MKTFEKSNYPNLLDRLSIDIDMAEKMIADFKFPMLLSRHRNKMVEDDILKIPLFVTAFYQFIKEKGVIPNPQEFWDKYKAMNNLNYDNKIMLGIAGRGVRAYISALRDIHFSLYLKKYLERYEVLYNESLDTREGIDVLVSKEGKNYGVHLYVETRRSLEFRNIKNWRHTDFDNIATVDLPLNFDGAKKINEFYLYGERELQMLKGKL